MLHLYLDSRDDFDARRVVNSLEHGNSILVLDSKDLPLEWWKIPLTDFLPPGHPGHQIEGLDQTLPHDDQTPADWLPDRCLVFTTPQLLELMSFVRKANVDGTFRVKKVSRFPIKFSLNF